MNTSKLLSRKAFSRHILLLLLFYYQTPFAQQLEELNTGWYCKPVGEVQLSGEEISGRSGIDVSDWMPATVPGTVLTTLLNNEKIADPFYGLNNYSIPDIYDTGRAHYTYWFYKELDIESSKTDEFWLILRGVNYSCDIFFNGEKVNQSTHHGMFLRQKYTITELVKKGTNRLAVIVHPPDPVGNPNGGQGGDGEIARNVTHQYVAGWDWIQPVRDRNTGIWDKVFLERTGPVDIRNPHIVTKLAGQRFADGPQEPAQIYVTAELMNSSETEIVGNLIINIDGQRIAREITLPAAAITSTDEIQIQIDNPRLWWPNGYGSQELYDLDIQFVIRSVVSDRQSIQVGIREIQTEWNPFTGSRQVSVNGQKVFIKGGNWIISDAMLRFSEERYDAEIRMHRDMNLNTIRIWGGAIAERPEFYQACDKYGLLVMQDFWISGDCNGRWLDAKKKEDQWTRRQYPDDDALFLKSAADQIKMIRNHPSLAFWCGGNELAPPEDLLMGLRDTLNRLDGTRWFAEYSTSDSMSFNTLGGNGDGPYGIQNPDIFFEHKTFPFNSEVGSVGLPDIEGLRRYLPEDAMVIPGQYQLGGQIQNSRWGRIHPTWRYHKYIPYSDFINKYGEPTDVADFAFKAQLVNYNQYRALIEGFSSHMWEWYTGVMIWKTQNPWTSMRGQMYDCYLDQNAGLYGLRSGSESVHVLFDHTKNQVMIANNSFVPQNDLMIQVHAFDMAGTETLIYQEIVSILPTSTKRFGSIARRVGEMGKADGLFLQMKLFDKNRALISENFYWLPNEQGDYSGLQEMEKADLEIKAVRKSDQLLEVTLQNNLGNPVSFFNRISVVNAQTELRLLPVFYSDNYISITPGETKTIEIDIGAIEESENMMLRIQGWNLETVDVEIN